MGNGPESQWKVVDWAEGTGVRGIKPDKVE
jgi:hypothetical protein